MFLEKTTMSSLRGLTTEEITSLQNGDYLGVRLNGYYIKGDTPAPIEYYLSDTAAADNGGNIIEVGGIKLEVTFIGETHVKYFGAKCDETTLDTTAWKNALNYLNLKCHILKFEGTSIIDETLTFNKEGIVLQGDSVQTSILKKTGNAKTSGIGVIAGVDYDGIDAVLVSVGYMGDFTFRSMKFQSEDKSQYILYLPKTYRFLLEDIYMEGGVENLRCLQGWNNNLRKVRSRFSDYAFRIEGPNLEQSTSFHFDNCYAEYAKFGYKLVAVAYFSANAVAADHIDECAYWFHFSVGGLSGVGTEKSKGQLIRCWGSNITINGHHVLNIINYTGIPAEAKSKAKIELWSANRNNTGLVLHSSYIGVYPVGDQPGDADWVYIGANTFLKLINWNHYAITTVNIKTGTVNGIFEKDSNEAYDRVQLSRPYQINGVSILPYTYAYNQNRIILNHDEIVIINTGSADAARLSVSVALASVLKVFADFAATDFYLRDFYTLKIKTNNKVSVNYFSGTNVYSDKVFTIGTGAPVLQSVSIDSENVIFTFNAAANRPVLTISRLK